MPAKPRTTLPAFAPVPRKCQRYDGWTPERQQAFIEALADYGSIRAAANSVGMTPESAYLLRRHPEAGPFRKAWEAALDLGMQRVEDVAMDRALNGVQEPVYSYGKIVGTRTIYNDRLLMFMLRNRAPKRFAADGARGMNALDKQRLAEEKRRWEREWTREHKARRRERAEAARGRLLAKLATLRQREEAMMSPRTRRLKAAYEQSLERDRKDPFHWQDESAASAHPDEAAPGPRPTRQMLPYLPGAKRSPEPAGPPTFEDWSIAQDPFGGAARNRARREEG